MVAELSSKLTIGISSRALFDLADSHAVFEEQGLQAYRDYQIAHEDQPLEAGAAYQLVRKLLALNEQERTPRVEVILLSRNSADTGLRIFKSIEQHGLSISRAAFTGGRTPFTYMQPFQVDLFLSAHQDDVRSALAAGHAAAALYPGNSKGGTGEELRIAFDGDAVLFDDQAERVFQSEGLEAFVAHEQALANEPLPGGPFKSVLAALNRLQAAYPEDRCPIRIALVTARSAPAHERAIRTLRAWDVRIDEALFLGGMTKVGFLQAFNADIYFDDQHRHCDKAADYVATGHVPHGVANQ